MTTDARARARRHPERGAAPRPTPVRGDLHPVPHRRPRARAGADAAARAPWWPRPPTRRARWATPGSASRSPTTASRRSGVPQDVARQLRLGVPAGHGGAGEGAGRHRREQPRALGAAARARPTSTSCSSALAPDSAQLEAALDARPPGLRALCRASTAIWRQDCHALPTETRALRVPGRHQPSGHRGQRHSRVPTRSSRRSRPASSSSATPTRLGGFRRCRSPTCSAATAPTWSSASSTSAWPRSGGT